MSPSRRFITALMCLVIALVGIFATMAITVNISRIEAQLTEHLEGVAALMARGLVNPLWNFDTETMTSVLKAALANEAIAYVSVVSDDAAVNEQMQPAFTSRELHFFEQSPKFFTTRSQPT